MSKLIVIIVVLIVIAGVGYVLYTRQNNASENTLNPQTSVPTSVIEEIVPTGTSMNDIMAGGNSYRDPAGTFAFLYPTDYKFDTQNNDMIVRVHKQGPTQQGQTELYDGAMVTFEKIDLKGQTLNAWLDNEIKMMTENGMTEITQPKKEITLNGFPGYSYSARGLGEFQFLVIQKDTSSPNAIRISALVSDPTKAGFQEQVDQIFASISLQK